MTWRIRPQREALAKNAAAMRLYAIAMGRPVPPNDPLYHAPAAPTVTPRRAKRTRTIGQATESQIQRAVLAYLRRVVKAEAIRYNSGQMSAGDDRSQRFIRFNDAAGHSDIGGVLPGGRAFYFEVKRPGEKPTEKQSRFLARMGRAGALVGVVTSVEDVAALVGPYMKGPAMPDNYVSHV